MGADDLGDLTAAAAQASGLPVGAALLQAEAEQVAAWGRCAEYLGRIASGTPGILDSRSAALILRHEAAIRGHLLAMADQMAGQAEETRGALEEDGRIIDRLMKDLGEMREERNGAFVEAGRLGEECAKLKATLEEGGAITRRLDEERDALLARLAQEQATAEGRGRALDCLRRDLEGARAEVLQARAEAEALRAERDAALADLGKMSAELAMHRTGAAEPRGCVVIELGVRVR